MVTKICDWVKYHNRHSSKSIRVAKLSFCQHDPPGSTPFWQKNSLVTHTYVFWSMPKNTADCCIFVYACKTKTSKPQNFWIAPSKKHFSGSNDQNWMPFGNSFHIWSSKAQCEQNAWKHAMLSIVHQPLQSHIGNPCTSGQVRWIITYRFVLQMTNDI